MFQELRKNYGLCLVAIEQLSMQLKLYKNMAEVIEVEDHEYEMEVLRLEGQIEEFRGIATYIYRTMKSIGLEVDRKCFQAKLVKDLQIVQDMI